MAHLSSGPRDGALCALNEIVGRDCDIRDGRSCEDVGPLSSLEINHGGIGRGREGERQEDG
jgi:hypothetical protein